MVASALSTGVDQYGIKGLFTSSSATEASCCHFASVVTCRLRSLCDRIGSRSQSGELILATGVCFSCDGDFLAQIIGASQFNLHISEELFRCVNLPIVIAVVVDFATDGNRAVFAEVVVGTVGTVGSA